MLPPHSTLGRYTIREHLGAGGMGDVYVAHDPRLDRLVAIRLLAAAPDLKVLVTSRAPLHLQREREYAVEPLEVPVFGSLPPLDELVRTPAVALFVERARETKRNFALTADNARAVVEVCRRLDGLPLAIELAAARARVLTPAAMLDRLEHQLKLLTGGARDLPSRQQTMRGAVAWSYELLEEAERAVLRRMAVFVGGATLEAVEAVCGWGGEDVLDAVQSLVDKSLLREREEAEEVRFRMLEVVREYAVEQLEASGEGERARVEHAHWFRDLAREAEPYLHGSEQGVWGGRLSRDAENLTAALGVMLEREPEEGAALVMYLGPYWRVCSKIRQACEWQRKALERATDPTNRVRLLTNLAANEAHLGKMKEGEARGREAVAEARALGNKQLLAHALGNLSFTLTFDLSDAALAEARAGYEESSSIARELGDDVQLSLCLLNLGNAARQAGDLGAARGYGEEALATGGRGLSLLSKSVILFNLGCISLEEGDVSAAKLRFHESVEIGAELTNDELVAYGLYGMAGVAVRAGELERGALLAGAAEVIFESTGIVVQASERNFFDRVTAELREKLDGETLDRKRARGRAMSIEEAVRVAVGD